MMEARQLRLEEFYEQRQKHEQSVQRNALKKKKRY